MDAPEQQRELRTRLVYQLLLAVILTGPLILAAHGIFSNAANYSL